MRQTQVRRYARSFAQAKTAAYTVLAGDHGKTFTNSGATGGFIFTLPTAVKGLAYEFFAVAGYPIVISVPSGIVLYRDGVAITGGSLILWQIGHSARVFCDGTSWYVMNEHTPEGQDRWVHYSNFMLRPGINANRDVPTGDTYNTTQMQLGIDKDSEWEALGVNVTSALVTHDPNGGLLLTTAGADGDEIIMAPHVNANTSGWVDRIMESAASPYFRARVRTQASVAKFIMWAGLKLTNTEVKATDDDQIFVRVEDDVNAGEFEVVGSRDGADVETDTGLAVAAATNYDIQIFVDAARVPRVFINGILYLTGAALVTGENLLPFVGVAADGTAPGAKALQLYDIYCSATKIT